MRTVKYHDYEIHDNGTITKDGVGVRIVISQARTAFVRLSINKRQDKVQVAYLIWKSFNTADAGKLYFKDEDPANCTLSNLTTTPPEKGKLEIPKETVQRVAECWTASNATLKRISELTEISQAQVKLIVCGKLHSDVSLLPTANYNKAVRLRYEQYSSEEETYIYIAKEICEVDGIDLSLHFYQYPPSPQKANRRNHFLQIKMSQNCNV